MKDVLEFVQDNVKSILFVKGQDLFCSFVLNWQAFFELYENTIVASSCCEWLPCNWDCQVVCGVRRVSRSRWWVWATDTACPGLLRSSWLWCRHCCSAVCLTPYLPIQQAVKQKARLPNQNIHRSLSADYSYQEKSYNPSNIKTPWKGLMGTCIKYSLISKYKYSPLKLEVSEVHSNTYFLK